MKFTKYCPQTSTGLWSGITEKSEYTEEEIKKDLIQFRNEPFAAMQHIMWCWKEQILSIEFIKELLKHYFIQMNIKDFENISLKAILIDKRQTTQNAIINCITYVKNGLVKYNGLLEKVLDYKVGTE